MILQISIEMDFFSDAFAEYILKYVSTHKDDVRNGIVCDVVDSTISHMLCERIVNLIEKELDHKKLNKDIEELFSEKNDNFGVSRRLDPNLDRTKLFHIKREDIKKTSIEALTIHDMKDIIDLNQAALPDDSAVCSDHLILKFLTDSSVVCSASDPLLQDPDAKTAVCELYAGVY